jgi:aminopeptidase 2
MAESISGGAAVSDKKPDEYRLPTTVYPRHYDLAFKTDLSTSPPTFGGEGLISLDILADTKDITFNLHPSLKVTHIALQATELKTAATVQIPVSALTVDEDQERGRVDLSNVPGGSLKQGSKVKLFLRWESELGGNMVGYYKSDGDKDEAGNTPM